MNKPIAYKITYFDKNRSQIVTEYGTAGRVTITEDEVILKASTNEEGITDFDLGLDETSYPIENIHYLKVRTEVAILAGKIIKKAGGNANA